MWVSSSRMFRYYLSCNNARQDSSPRFVDHLTFLLVMDFVLLIDKLLNLKSNLNERYDLEIHITNSLTIRLLDERTRKSTLIDKTKLNKLSCECTEIYNRVSNSLKPYTDNVLPL